MRLASLLMIGIATAATGLAAGTATADTLRILTYEGYADDDWIAAFEGETGANVNVVFAGSPEEMIAKMQGSGGADYDIVAIDTSLIARYAGSGLIQPMDEDLLPNLPNLLSSFAEIDLTIPEGERLAVPFSWGSLGFIYDRGTFDEPPRHWDVLWDPEYAGRVLMGDDGNNNIVNTALSIGIEDPYNFSPEDAEAVKARLIEVKSNLLAYYAGGEEGVTLFEQNDVVLMTAFGEMQHRELERRGFDVGYVVPEEGAVGWVDCWAISSGARNLELAHAWIDFWLRPETGAAMSERYGYGNTTADSIDMEYASRLVWLEEPEDFAMRTTLWNEVKAAVAP